MNPNRTYEENMAALKKVLTQRTYTALSHRNIEFVLKYQNASLQELAAYLRRQQAELRHMKRYLPQGSVLRPVILDDDKLNAQAYERLASQVAGHAG